MARGDFTYEVREGATESVWIEDYVVRGRDGESVGTVATVLEHEGRRLLVVERGLVPVANDRRAVPWERVERVDHDALAVWLTLESTTFEGQSEKLDPSLGVEYGSGDADARRIAETPPGELPPAQAATRGPVDRVTDRIAILLAAIAFFTLLAIVAAATATGTAWPMLLAFVPAAFGIAAVVVAYRAYRQPYERRGADKP